MNDIPRVGGTFGLNDEFTELEEANAILNWMLAIRFVQLNRVQGDPCNSLDFPDPFAPVITVNSGIWKFWKSLAGSDLWFCSMWIRKEASK
ncbi:hypothetical protein [Kribbella sp. CA-294648]|uniref:hypothetical protein n=1 Tax=Kribbella sp. CA-294648 TaxID=3239948 RepID=UPI003D906CB6